MEDYSVHRVNSTIGSGRKVINTLKSNWVKASFIHPQLIFEDDFSLILSVLCSQIVPVRWDYFP